MPVRSASVSLLAAAFAVLGCRAQQPAPAAAAAPAPAPVLAAGTPLSPELAWKVETMLRQKAELPPESTVQISGRTPSDLPGYQTVNVIVTSQGRVSRPIVFLLSDDNKTLAQFTKFDISPDPKRLVSSADRPARGGPDAAPVQIVEFDDLECPYCARLHNALFPTLTERYGDKVHIVYRDWTLEQHPWAVHAAIDVNCLAAQSGPGYWTTVDYIHAHAGDMGADPKDPKAEKTLARANEQLDAVVRQQGEFRKVDMPRLNACLARQDTTGIAASQKLGDLLGVSGTPTLFINGDKIDGAVSLEYLFGVIDHALLVAGVQPPPPYTAPAAPAAPAPPAQQPSAAPGTK